MKIKLVQESTREDVLEYESNIIPMKGDIYAGIQFKDHYGRTVVSRMLMPGYDDVIIVYVDYTYPQLVEADKETVHEAHALALTDNIS